MTENVDVENADRIPDHLIDGFRNDGQIPAGRTTADHPGPYNRPLYDRNGNPIFYTDETNSPAPIQEDRKKKPSKTDDKNTHGAAYAGTNNEAVELNWWQRNMPRFLGGASQERKKAYFERQRQLTSAGAPRSATEGSGLVASQEVVTGVSVADLRQAGFNDSTIQHMLSVVEAKKQAEAQKMGGMQNLAQYLAQHGETVTLNAQELGISERQISIIKGIADKNNANC